MDQLNAKEVKEKITRLLEERGPSLPVQVAKAVNLSTIFASAFLSELASEGIVKISDMKVGGSPLYYTQNQVAMLANFTKYLNAKEREAFELLKKNQILSDELQQPAIRVALRGLKDFAFPFKKDEKIFWRYFLINEKEAESKEIKEVAEEVKEIPEIEEGKLKPQEAISALGIENNEELEKVKKELQEKRLELEKFKQEIEAKREERRRKSKSKKKIVQKDETFLNELKNDLKNKDIEIINIENFDKKEVIGRIKKDNKEYLFYAINKKKVEESDIAKAYKLSLTSNLSYYIFSKGEASKKVKEAIEAHKKLSSLEKIKTQEQ